MPKKIDANEVMNAVFELNLQSKLSKDEKIFQPIGYEYKDMTLSELAYLGKNDIEAKNELISRLKQSIILTSYKMYKQNNTIKVEDIQHLLFSMANKAIQKYNPEKGEFIHYYRSIASRAFAYAISAMIKEKQKEKTYLGIRVSYLDVDTPFLSDVTYSRSFPSGVTWLDFDLFFKEYPNSQKEVMMMYFKGYTIKEISQHLHETFNYVTSLIYRLKRKFFDTVLK